jgi:hypothetical protein
MDMFAEPKMPKEIPTAHLRFPWAPQAARVCAPAWRLRWHFWDLMDHAAKAEGLVIATATHRMRGVYHDFCLSPFDKNRPPFTSSTDKSVYEFVKPGNCELWIISNIPKKNGSPLAPSPMLVTADTSAWWRLVQWGYPNSWMV